MLIRSVSCLTLVLPLISANKLYTHACTSLTATLPSGPGLAGFPLNSPSLHHPTMSCSDMRSDGSEGWGVDGKVHSMKGNWCRVFVAGSLPVANQWWRPHWTWSSLKPLTDSWGKLLNYQWLILFIDRHHLLICCHQLSCLLPVV